MIEVWMTDSSYNFNHWTISKAVAENVDIVNRTDNATENFNRRLNAACSTAHPNLYSFIDMLRIELTSIANRVQDIRIGKAIRPAREYNIANVNYPPLFAALLEEQ
jgi:hypothetical protein